MSVSEQIIGDVIKTGTRKEMINCIREYAGEEFLRDDVWDLAGKDMSELRKVLRNIKSNFI